MDIQEYYDQIAQQTQRDIIEECQPWFALATKIRMGVAHSIKITDGNFEVIEKPTPEQAEQLRFVDQAVRLIRKSHIERMCSRIPGLDVNEVLERINT